MKLTREIKAVPPGEIYPETFEAGQECPAWLEPVAKDLKAVQSRKSRGTAPENK